MSSVSRKRGQISAAAASTSGGSSRSSPRGKRKHTAVDEIESQSNQKSAVTVSNGTPSKKLSTKLPTTNVPSPLLSSSDESSDDPRPAKRRSAIKKITDKSDPKAVKESRVGTVISADHNQSPRPTTFAEMYTFRAKGAAAQNGVIDLTTSKSPPTSPLRNGVHSGPHKSTFNPHQGPKRLIVKNIRTVVKEDKGAFFERKWKEQSAALDALFQDEGSKLLLEELYKGAEYVCRQGLSEELYGKLRHKCVEHLDHNLRANLQSKVESSSAIEIVKLFVGTWTLWQKQLQTIRHIFFYLNQTYLVRSADDPDIDTMGLQLFRGTVFADPSIQKQVLNGAVELVAHDRAGLMSAQEKDLSKQVIVTFHDLGVYSSSFEPVLIRASEDFFKTWRMSDAESEDLPHYVRSCSGLLDRELARCDAWGLDRTTKAKLLSLTDEILIEDNVPRLSQEDSLLDMMEGDMMVELEQTYTLLARKEQQQTLGAPFAKFIETEGSVIVFDEERESEMVVRLLDFKKRLDQINKVSFHDNENLGNTMHKAFEVFMNKTKKTQATWDTDNAKPGEMIAKHVDLLLKGGPKAIPGLRKADSDKAEEEQDFDNETDEIEVEKHLDDALDLFRFVHGKAVFEAFYKKDLARRLLMGRTQSFDAERSMLTRLKNECGQGFTHNLESMFKDMELAREEMKSYNQRLSDRGVKSSPDISVNVLSVAAWPTYPDIPVSLPTNISKAQADFERHYKEKHVGRKLTWKPSLAHCQLKACFPKGNKEIVVSGFQAIVLLLFNDNTTSSLSYADIKTATALPDAELVRTLQSLACAKYRVLSKTPRSRDVNPTDTFAFNAGFTDSKFRVKINQIQLKETKEENKETHERVAADRHYETQAAIVRIMKGKKVIGHNELIVEVIKATRSRGVLDQGDIKKNIEKLIEKEYMERDETLKNTYRYLA